MYKADFRPPIGLFIRNIYCIVLQVPCRRPPVSYILFERHIPLNRRPFHIVEQIVRKDACLRRSLPFHVATLEAVSRYYFSPL